MMWPALHPEAWQVVVGAGWAAACVAVALGALTAAWGAFRRSAGGIGAGVAVVLVGLLAAWPCHVEQRRVAEYLRCRHNVEDLAGAIEAYEHEPGNHGPPKRLIELVPLYLNAIPTCPAAGGDTYSASYEGDPVHGAFTVMCAGESHVVAGQRLTDLPRVTPRAGLVPPLER